MIDIPHITTESGSLKSFVDGYVLGEHGGSVYYLSIFGAVGATQAVGASIVSNKIVRLYGAGEYGKDLYRQFGKVKYRMISQRLPVSKMLSMVILSESCMLSDEQDFVIIIKNEDPKDILFRNLIHRSEIPLHSAWKEWLWETFVHFEWINELPGYKMSGYEVSFDDDELADKIESGIKNGTMPEIKK